MVNNKDYIGAIQKYSEGLQDCRPFYLMSCPEELLKEYVQLCNNLLNNIALCYLNIHEYDLCISMAKEVGGVALRGLEVLKTDEENVKALFRISMAHEMKGNLELAFEFIQTAYDIQKKYGQIEKSIMEKFQQVRYKLNKDKGASSQKEASFYKRMFN